jgi:hypothetical protein
VISFSWSFLLQITGTLAVISSSVNTIFYAFFSYIANLTMDGHTTWFNSPLIIIPRPLFVPEPNECIRLVLGKPSPLHLNTTWAGQIKPENSSR